MKLSVKPPKSFLPKAFQANEVQMGFFYFLVVLTSLFLTGSIVKSAIDFSLSLIKSQTLIPLSVAAQTHWSLGLNEI